MNEEEIENSEQKTDFDIAIEDDIKNGNLDSLADKAIESFEKGECKPL